MRAAQAYEKPSDKKRRRKTDAIARAKKAKDREIDINDTYHLSRA